MLRNEIVVISPMANTTAEVGRAMSICWAYNSAEERLAIQLQQASGELVLEVCRDLPNHGFYSWTPLGLSGGAYRIAVKSSSAEGVSAAFSLKEGAPCSNPVARVQRILSSSPQDLSLSAARSYEAYALPKQARAPRTVAYSALEVKRPNGPNGSVKPSKLPKPVARTNGPAVTLSASEVRRCLHQMLNDPNVAVEQELPNGDTVGRFAIKYILMHAQRRENKRED